MKTFFKAISVIIIVIFILFICMNKVKAEDENIVIVLDAGHGGTDPGAQNLEYGFNESDLNLKIARYLRDYLNEYDGITVLMTHNGIEATDYLELVDRGMYARNNNADMMISLHLNANNISLLYGAEVYVTANTSLPKYNENSTKLASSILNKLSNLGIYNRGVKTRLSDEPGEKYTYSDGTIADYYGVIRYPMKGDSEGLGVDIASGEGIPGIIIEHCFIRGNDVKFIDSEEDLKKLAKADCDGIVEYYGLRKKGEAVKTVSIDKKNVTLVKDNKTKLTATVGPDTALNKKVTWKSSNEKVAIVDNNGNVTAVGIGKAIITVTTEDNKKTAETTITVKELEINVDKDIITMLKGETVKLNADTSVENSLKWESGDTSIATVDNKGLITALKKGRTSIKVTIEGTKVSKDVLVIVNELSNEQKITINNLKNENGVLSKIAEKTLTEDFFKNFKLSDNLSIELTERKKYISTNTIVEIKDKKTNDVITRYYCIVYGDINEDGAITPADYVKIKNHIMGVSKLNNMQYIVADIDRNNKISPADYVKVKNHIMKVTTISI